MKINARDIESMGGCIWQPLEPNTPELPELDDIEIDAVLFDGIGLFQHENKYYKISYAKLEEVKGDEQVSRAINEYRYGNRLPDDYLEITPDDLALTFGEIEECERLEYVSYLIDGLVSNAEKLNIEDGERDVLSIDKYCEKLREIEKSPPKYLYLFKDREELVEQFDGKIYCIHDEKGDYLCDLLEDDMLNFVDKGTLIPAHGDDDINETKLSSPKHKVEVLATRFEAIIFLKGRRRQQ